MTFTYRVHRASNFALTADWNALVWKQAETAEVAHFYSQSSDHHPRTNVRMLYNSSGIQGIFQIQDQYVRCLHSGYQEDVWQDACVEFFVQPRPERGYFNFEMNCGGSLLSYYVADATRIPGGFAEFSPLKPEDGRQVQIRTTLPAIIDPEIVIPVTWTLEFLIPFALLEEYVGPLREVSGQEWHANFYKCAENNSHPHWASWNPLPELNFHYPDAFGCMRFE